MSNDNELRSDPNVWRDGNLLVVPIEEAVFPDRCVKTNVPVDKADYKFVTDLLPSQINLGHSTLDRMKAGAMAAVEGRSLLTELVGKRRLRFEIGLSETRKARAKRRWRVGLLLIVASPVLIALLGLAAESFDVAEKLGVAGDPSGPPSSVMPIACVAVGMVVMITGIVLIAIAVQGVLRVNRAEGHFVWLAGAGPDFLASLPQFVPEKAVGKILASRALSRRLSGE